MNFLPNFDLTLFSGILPFLLYALCFGITVALFSKDARIRLYDRDSWSKKQKVCTLISKLFALLNLFIFIFSPLETKSVAFVIGVSLFILSLVGLVHSLVIYKNTPLDTPVTGGIYKFSRNPQMVFIWLVFLSIGFMINSILSIIVLLIGVLFSHISILAEEKSCTDKYGQPYIYYKNTVPRYLFFKSK